MAYKAKVAKYKGDLENLLKKYSEDFALINSRRTKQYVMKNKNKAYSIKILHNAYKKYKDYNIILCVTGPESEKVTQTIDDIIKKLNIDFEDAPAKEKIKLEVEDKLKYRDYYKSK